MGCITSSNDEVILGLNNLAVDAFDRHRKNCRKYRDDDSCGQRPA